MWWELKQRLVSLLRQWRLLEPVDGLRLLWVILRDGRANITFLRGNKNFTAPPLALMYDAYSTVSYPAYWEGGKRQGKILTGLMQQHCPHATSVLEWGCGPARILRHLRVMLPESVKLYGADYNQRSIDWCRKKIPGISFVHNQLSPPLPLTEKFDVVYAVSVLTHLSEEQQVAWMKELRRVLKPGGCLILTTHGERSAERLLPHEYARFEKEGIVIRDGVEEGKRCFVAYHHPRYAREQLFAGMEICDHLPEHFAAFQDAWVVKAA